MLADNILNTKLSGGGIWDAALESLRHEYGDSTYRSWFSQLSFVEQKANTVILGVPSRFIKEWIDYNYLSAIKETIQSVSPLVNNLEIQITASQALSTISNTLPAFNAANDEIALSGAKCDLMDFDLDPRYTFANFIVGPSNKVALNAARMIADNSKLPGESNILYIQSPVGMGKTHLLQSVAAEFKEKNPNLKIAYLSADKFMHLYISAIKRNDLISLQAKMRKLDLLLIDDIQFICGKNATQQELGQTFSQLTESNKKVVISCDTTPYNLNLDQRTKSRIAGGLCVVIKPSDYDTRLEILIHKAKSLATEIPEEVIKYLAGRICSSIRELEGAISKLAYFASFEEREITIEFATEILLENFEANEKKLSVDLIIDLVAEYHKLTATEIRNKSRAAKYSIPRQTAAYLAKQMTSKSLQEIGFKLGGKDHATVIYSVKKLEAKLKASQEFSDEVAKIVNFIGERSSI
jgi:chromosomal replication initiator protein